MINNKPINYGFVVPVIVPKDFWLGSGKLGSIVLNEKGDWRDYLPIFEHQRKTIETNSCVTFGILSALEILHKFQYGNEVNYSDRFTSKISDTDPRVGNTPKKVSMTIREFGTISEKEWPFVETLEEYFKDIPQKLIDIGANWLKEYEFGYEWVDRSNLKEALRRSPVGIAVSAWQQNEKDEYIYFGTWNHWVVLVAYDEQDRPIIWDSYDTGLKVLEKDFKFGFPQIYTLKRKEQKISFWQRIKNYINKLLK